MVKGKEVKGKPKTNALHKFKQYFYAKHKGKGKYSGLEVAKRVAIEAWENLPEEERRRYGRMTKEEREGGAQTSSSKEVGFSTRCSPRQFGEIAEHVRGDQRLRERAAAIEFGKILEIRCTKMYHEVYEEWIDQLTLQCLQSVSEGVGEMLVGRMWKSSWACPMWEGRLEWRLMKRPLKE